MLEGRTFFFSLCEVYAIYLDSLKMNLFYVTRNSPLKYGRVMCAEKTRP